MSTYRIEWTLYFVGAPAVGSAGGFATREAAVDAMEEDIRRVLGENLFEVHQGVLDSIRDGLLGYYTDDEPIIIRSPDTYVRLTRIN